jgi:hypothetical protein
MMAMRRILFMETSGSIITAWKRSSPPPMYNPYDPPQQGFASLPPDTAYKPAPHPQPSAAYQDSPLYPPGPPTGQLSAHSFPSTTTFKPSEDVEDGIVLRGGTPSPTPSEEREMKTGAIDWKTITNWRFWIRKEWICMSGPEYRT